MMILGTLFSSLSASILDDLSQRLQKETQRMKQDIKKEFARTDIRLQDLKQETKQKTKRAWNEHKDEILHYVIKTAKLYTNDADLTKFILEKSGLLRKNDSPTLVSLLSPYLATTLNDSNQSQIKSPSHSDTIIKHLFKVY